MGYSFFTFFLKCSLDQLSSFQMIDFVNCIFSVYVCNELMYKISILMFSRINLM